ncbi:hypothetical protein LRP49_05825 [Enterovibrio sp. ZSDZ35]|uniref:Uncharacterized protein n=1 Tax=Enterovibrio qingdaonensis TaxID=2899818 RepID=A0ABT5QJD2_9GAMM|nr:hypothetical protein [Enterovibrio sp. ZSDZ35]MDD1780719.1 hypothetical protein [Enterovibrio sp. ZSDZ35]
MESKLYIVINAKQTLGQSLSMRLAQRGNNVVFLSNDEQLGYALAAEEPRVRFRRCTSLNSKEVAAEYHWSERCISAVHGIVIMVPIKESLLLDDDYCQALLSDCGYQSTNRDSSLSITYVVFPEQDDESLTLKSLHLELCKRAHNADKRADTPRVNHVILSDIAAGDTESDADLANETSELIHYLTSTTSQSLQSQAFYFGNNRNQTPI